MHLLLATAALAATQGFSFVPWSGAAIALNEDGAAVEASLSTPFLPGPRSTWGLTFGASIPTQLLSATAGGTYEVTTGLSRNNARDLKRAIDMDLFAATLEAGFDTNDIARAAQRMSAWCEVFDDKKATSWSDDRIRDAVGASSAKQRQAWVARIDGFIAQDPSVKRATCATPLTDMDLRATLPALRNILVNVEAMEKESAFFASDVAATPLNQLALRQVPRLLMEGGPVVTYDWTVTQEEAGDPIALSTHGGEAALQGALYFPAGFGLAGAVGATSEWPVEGSEDPAYAGFIELGGVWTSPASLRIPVPAADIVTVGPEGTPTGGAVTPAVPTPVTPATDAASDSDAETTETTPPADNTAVTATTDAATGTPAAFYVAVELRLRGQYGTTGDEEMVGLSLALRPTGAGVGLAFGGQLDRADDTITVLPVVSIAGELPDLVTQR